MLFLPSVRIVLRCQRVIHAKAELRLSHNKSVLQSVPANGATPEACEGQWRNERVLHCTLDYPVAVAGGVRLHPLSSSNQPSRFSCMQWWQFLALPASANKFHIMQLCVSVGFKLEVTALMQRSS